MNVSGLVVWNQSGVSFDSTTMFSSPAPVISPRFNCHFEQPFFEMAMDQDLSFAPINMYFNLFCLGLLVDLSLNGLGGVSNSLWISFLDSLSHCSSWILANVSDSTDLNPLPIELKFIGAFLSKNLCGLVTHSFFGFPPPFSQSLSLVSFLVALWCSHSIPSLAIHVRSSQGPWRVLFVFIGSLNKSRKLRFALNQNRSRFVQMLILGLITVELSGCVNIALRSYWKNSDVLELFTGLGEFIFQYRLRIPISILAILCEALHFPPIVTIVLLALHKSSVVGADGKLMWNWTEYR